MAWCAYVSSTGKGHFDKRPAAVQLLCESLLLACRPCALCGCTCEPVVAILVTAAAITSEVVALVVLKVGLLEAVMVIGQGPHAAGPRPLDHQVPANPYTASLPLAHTSAPFEFLMQCLYGQSSGHTPLDAIRYQPTSLLLPTSASTVSLVPSMRLE